MGLLRAVLGDQRERNYVRAHTRLRHLAEGVEAPDHVRERRQQGLD